MTTLATLEPATQSVLPFNSPNARDQWLNAPVDAFIAWRRNMKAANGFSYDDRSVRQHAAMWATFIGYCQAADINIQSVSPAQLESFIGQLRGRAIKAGQASVRYAPGECPEATPATRRRYVQLLERTFDHLNKIGVRRGNPMAPLMPSLNKPVASGYVSFLTQSEETAFLAYVNGVAETNWHDQRDKVMLLLLSASGITEGELVALKVADVSFGDFEPALRVAEHRLTRAHTTTVNKFAVPTLQRWCKALDVFSSDAPLFPNAPGSTDPMLPKDVYLITRLALEASGFRGQQRGPMTVRNTFIRRQIYSGIDAAVINRWIGVETNKTYNRLHHTIPNLQGVSAAEPRLEASSSPSRTS